MLVQFYSKQCQAEHKTRIKSHLIESQILKHFLKSAKNKVFCYEFSGGSVMRFYLRFFKR
jgi:hypothetical protein